MQAFRYKRVSILIFIILLIILVGYFTLTTFHLKLENSKLTYPKELPGNIGVINIYIGDDALSRIKSIHWDPSKILIEDAVIVEYSDGSRLWLAKTSKAQELLNMMINKIKENQGMLPYQLIHKIDVSGVEVYIISDTRFPRIHAVWVENNIIAWLEVPFNSRDFDRFYEILVYVLRYIKA
ncbi:MAG: hypothetical protein F7C81_02065 [Desulfurococcales archaeon]|nr:hypothetical protein [Desulfurococcales archaeon]